jgi:hypothetical protein
MVFQKVDGRTKDNVANTADTNGVQPLWAESLWVEEQLDIKLLEAFLQFQRELGRLKGWIIGIQDSLGVIHGGVRGGGVRYDRLDCAWYPGEELYDAAQSALPTWSCITFEVSRMERMLVFFWVRNGDKSARTKPRFIIWCIPSRTAES